MLNADTDLDDRLTLAPGRRAAAAWTGLAVAVLGAVVWILVDSRGHPAAWVALAVAGTMTAFFALQLALPRLFTFRLDHERLRGRVLVTSVEVDWADVQLARVYTVAGDPMLELQVTDRAGGQPRGVGLLLPVGADLDALHRFLARRLGRSDTTPTEPATR